ncbi:MAG: YgiQ family radical SAM protein [Candidatus Fimadaptatus sp.]|jgi:uncharacterized radical SAM protein YgiQ
MMSDTQQDARFLPVTAQEMRARGWDEADFVYVSGDAYVDHPSFGHAIICRVLESAGYRVAMISQPDWQSEEDFKRFGAPRLGFMVSAGNIDSMVNHYTVAKRPRDRDSYSPGGEPDHRPDRATIVYCNMIRRAYPHVPIVIGGVEASLRRFAHYDYWDDRVRNSILVDSGADILSYGMGERCILEIARALEDGALDRRAIRGTCRMMRDIPKGYIELPGVDEVRSDKRAYCEMYNLCAREQDPVRGRGLAQRHGDRYLVAHPPQMPLSTKELDRTFALPFTRRWHPMYDAKGGIPALDEVKFSIMATRGCFGSCSFCALTFHQGRIVTARSHESVLDEARALTRMPDFKGYIHDVGGPTANFRRPACPKQLKSGTCPERQCLFPDICKAAQPDHSEFVKLLRDMRAIPGIKKVFIRSGLRYDWMLKDRDGTFLRELVEHHVSGQLKVAPEHVSPRVLAMMGKPGQPVFEEFARRYAELNRRMGKKQYLVCYFMSSHPGSELSDAVRLAEFLRDSDIRPEQVQDFYPTPGTLSTAMYYTGLDPRTMKPVYVPRSPHEKAMQRALMQYSVPGNADLVRQALRLAGRENLIGYDRKCLVRPASPHSYGRGRDERGARDTPSDQRRDERGARGTPSDRRRDERGARGNPSDRRRDERGARGNPSDRRRDERGARGNPSDRRRDERGRGAPGGRRGR